MNTLSHQDEEASEASNVLPFGTRGKVDELRTETEATCSDPGQLDARKLDADNSMPTTRCQDISMPDNSMPDSSMPMLNGVLKIV